MLRHSFFVNGEFLFEKDIEGGFNTFTRNDFVVFDGVKYIIIDKTFYFELERYAKIELVEND